MKTYYLDADFRVHVSPADELIPWEDTSGYFDGKCDAYIEGYRVVPESSTWIRKDGVAFKGLMISAAVPYSTLIEVQSEYDANENKHMKEALALLGVTMDE